MTKILIFFRIILMKSKFKKILLIFVNTLTLSRLVGAFVLPFIYLKYGASVSAIVTIILFSTDAVDGFLARTFKISTMFGSAMDALCDKVLSLTAFIILGLEYNIMFIPLGLELIIILINYLIYRAGGNVQSSLTGKIKTVIIDISTIISFILISLPALKININYNINTLILIFGILSIIAEIFAIINYSLKYKRTLKDPTLTKIKYQNRKRKTLKEALTDSFSHEYYLEHRNESILKQLYK